MNVYIPYTRLPSEYQEVEYIENTGTTQVQYIDTGVTATANISMELVMTPNTSYTNGEYAIMGTDWTSQGIFLMFYNNVWRYHQGGSYGDISGISNAKTTVAMSSTGFSVNGTSTSFSAGSDYTRGGTILLFTTRSVSTNPSRYRVSKFKTHELKIWDSGTLVRDLVPCYRKSDSVIGMYDLVNDQFYTNQGTGIFSKGNDVTMSEVQNIYIGEYKPIYKGEYIEYKMNADSSGNLYVPVGGFNISGSINSTYDWYVSVDGGSATNYSGTGSSGGSITLSGYVAGTNHTIKIVPTTVDYRWARAYGWKNTPGCTFLTEIVYDASYMGYAYDASSVGGYFRANQYYGCTSITNPADEYLPDGVETISNYFRYCQYYNCESLLFSPEEFLPDTVTTIGSNFRRYQYYSCSALTNIKGWKDLSIGNGNYRNSQYYGCTSNKTVKVLSDVGYDSYSSDTLENAYVTSVSVPSQYLSNFTSTNNNPRVNITDSKFIGY